MVQITGYKKKSEPKWVYLLLAFAVAGVLLLLLLGIGFILEKIERMQANVPVTTSTLLPTTTMLKPLTNITAEVEIEKEVANVVPPTISVGINQVVISSGIEQHRPIDDLGQVELAQGMIYCYSRVALTVVPQTISHCWYGPKGNLIAEIKLTIARNPADTWSYVGLANGGRGNWTVIIKAADGTELAKKQFQVI